MDIRMSVEYARTHRKSGEKTNRKDGFGSVKVRNSLQDREYGRLERRARRRWSSI